MRIDNQNIFLSILQITLFLILKSYQSVQKNWIHALSPRSVYERCIGKVESGRHIFQAWQDSIKEKTM